MQVSGSKPRLDWLDAAKAYGMFLVFYGHFAQRIDQRLDVDVAFLHVKAIYAFHMVLFVIISGYLARETFVSPRAYLSRAVASRLVPVVFFSVLMVPVHYVRLAPEPVDEVHTELNADWISNWQRYARPFAPPEDGVLHPSILAIVSQFSETSRGDLQTAAEGDSISTQAKEQIIAELDELLDRVDLHNLNDFADIGMPPMLDQLQQRGPPESLSPEDLRRYNMLLYRKARWPHWNQDTVWSLITDDRTWRGLNSLNVPTWFLIALFTIESIHFVVGRFLVAAPWRAALALPVFALAGWYLTLDIPLFSGDIWFAREAVLLYAFYLLGWLLRKLYVIEVSEGWRAWALFLLSSACLLQTFDLNPGAVDLIPIVLINLSRHGDPVWFAIGAVTGSLAVIGLARALPVPRFVSFAGRNSLTLLCLNGAFFAYFNQLIVSVGPEPTGHASVLLYAGVVSLASMAACVPFILLFRRYVPQLIGHPQDAGPWLPALVKR